MVMRPLSWPVSTGSAGALFGGARGQKVERQPMLRIVQLGRERQPELEQSVEQPVLGELDLAPVRLVLGLGQVRDHPVVTAGRAELLGAVHRNQPVARAELRVGAVAIAAPALRQRPQSPPAFFQSADRRVGRQIAEVAAAALAAGVLEIKRLPAMLAFKEFHERSAASGLASMRSSATVPDPQFDDNRYWAGGAAVFSAARACVLAVFAARINSKRRAGLIGVSSMRIS